MHLIVASETTLSSALSPSCGGQISFREAFGGTLRSSSSPVPDSGVPQLCWWNVLAADLFGKGRWERMDARGRGLWYRVLVCTLVSTFDVPSPGPVGTCRCRHGLQGSMRRVRNFETLYMARDHGVRVD
jgi:hypothetical protein